MTATLLSTGYFNDQATLPNPSIEFLEKTLAERLIVECGECGSKNVSEKYHAQMGFSFQGCKDCRHVWRTS